MHGLARASAEYEVRSGFQQRHDAATLDSPVPQNAPRFDPDFIAKEDRAHLGSGNERGVDGLVASGGVMSRGLVGTSRTGRRRMTRMQSEESIVNVSRITERSPSELKQVVVANLRKRKEHRAKALSELERAYVFRIEAEQHRLEAAAQHKAP